MATAMKTLTVLAATAALLLPAAQTTTGAAAAFAPPHQRGRTGGAVSSSGGRKRRPSPPSPQLGMATDGQQQGFGASPEADLSQSSSVSRPSVPQSPPKSSDGGGGEFELQEMKFQLRGMLKRNIPSRALQPAKRDELAGYVRSVASRIPSPTRVGTLAEPGALQGTWKLAFSTEAATLGDLPREANVVVRFKDDRKVDYVLEFTKKVWGLEGITAESSYMVDPGPLNPGLITMVYDKITAKIFGKTVPTGLFGMLKGRANYIETIWFDGDFWIDRGFGPDGTEYFNVFVKDDGTWGAAATDGDGADML